MEQTFEKKLKRPQKKTKKNKYRLAFVSGINV